MAKFCPVFAPFAPFLPPFGLFFARLGFRIAWTVLLLASLAVRRSPLARAAKNGQFWPVFGLFWPVFGLFWRGAVTVVSGAKCQPSQHPGTPRVVTDKLLNKMLDVMLMSVRCLLACSCLV